MAQMILNSIDVELFLMIEYRNVKSNMNFYVTSLYFAHEEVKNTARSPCELENSWIKKDCEYDFKMCATWLKNIYKKHFLYLSFFYYKSLFIIYIFVEIHPTTGDII